MDAYSVVLEIKIDGKRVAGGVYELEEIRADSAWAGEGFGFYDLDPHGRLTPTALQPFVEPLWLHRMTMSICVVRKSDKKCLHLVTDIVVENAEHDYIVFDGYQHIDSSSFNNVDGNYVKGNSRAIHDFRLYGADVIWDEEENYIMRGFTDPYGELTLWDAEASDSLPAEIVLRRWHASKNWV